MSLADAPVGAEVDGLRVVAAPHVDVKRADADGSARAAVRDAAVRAPLLRIVTFEGTEAELRARLARLTDGFTVEGMLAAPLANNDNSNSSSSSGSSSTAGSARKQRRRAHANDDDSDDDGGSGDADDDVRQRFVLLVQLHGRVAVAREGLVSQFVRARM